MKHILHMLAVSSVVIAGSLFAKGQSIDSTRVVTGGLVTLYAYDPIAQSLCLTDGGFGSVIKEFAKYNRCSHLNFNSYVSNGFQVGVQGGEQGIIIDLGGEIDLQKRYGYASTVGGNGFASLNVQDGKVYFLKDYKSRNLIPVDGTDILFHRSPDHSQTQVSLGHIYILRVWDRHDEDMEIIAKLIVVAFTPGESVTFRWQLLKNEKSVNQ